MINFTFSSKDKETVNKLQEDILKMGFYQDAHSIMVQENRDVSIYELLGQMIKESALHHPECVTVDHNTGEEGNNGSVIICDPEMNTNDTLALLPDLWESAGYLLTYSRLNLVWDFAANKPENVVRFHIDSIRSANDDAGDEDISHPILIAAIVDFDHIPERNWLMTMRKFAKKRGFTFVMIVPKKPETRLPWEKRPEIWDTFDCVIGMKDEKTSHM